MKRTHIFFPEQLQERLKLASEKLGLPMAEIIRRAIDEFLARMGI